jgi:hypothetical protein
MAKLAVLTCRPRTSTMHWAFSPWPTVVELGHGWVGSERRKPFSRARLSRRIGMKEAGIGGVSHLL